MFLGLGYHVSDSQGRNWALAVPADPDRVYVMVCITLLWFRVRLWSVRHQPQHLGELQEALLARTLSLG